jgi:hypothetical protein
MAPAGLVSDGRRTLRLRARLAVGTQLVNAFRRSSRDPPRSDERPYPPRPRTRRPHADPRLPGNPIQQVSERRHALCQREKLDTGWHLIPSHTRTRRPRSVSQRQPRIAVGTIPPRKAVVDPSAHLANMRTQRVSIAASAEVRVRLLGGKLEALATQIPPQVANLSLECGLPR